jgi:EAL domain-containing protein (putative c-di-GMP-specific phosphodiesterase class I)
MTGERFLLDALGQPGALAVALQPILEIRNPGAGLHGFEALVRGPAGCGLGSAAALFDRARRAGVETRVDRLCLEAIFGAIEGKALPGRLAVNVHASTLASDRDFPSFLGEAAARHGVDVSRVTVEIVEAGRSSNDGVFQHTLRALREAGAAVALDDVGLGQASYALMLDCAPSYLKVDRYLVAGCGQDLRRRAVLDSVFLLGARLGARMIAEGVETAEEMSTLSSIGVELFQGFFLCRPIAAHDLPRTPQAGSPADAGLPTPLVPGRTPDGFR